MSGFLDGAGDAASRGAALGGTLGFVVALIPRLQRPLTEVMQELVLIAGFWALLGSLFGVVYEGFAALS